MGSDRRTYKSMYETGKASEIVCCRLAAEIYRRRHESVSDHPCLETDRESGG